MAPGIRADVDDVVGGTHHLFVVLYDDDGIAEITEATHYLDQAFSISLVEADTGLIEYVE